MKKKLPKYQNNLCASSNHEYPEIKKMLNKNILKTFTIKNEKKENIIIPSRFDIFIWGVERLRISRR